MYATRSSTIRLIAVSYTARMSGIILLLTADARSLLRFYVWYPGTRFTDARFEIYGYWCECQKVVP